MVTGLLVVMASEIEGDVKKTLLDRTDAEKVFRPWWDTVEDYLLNILIGLGGWSFGPVPSFINIIIITERTTLRVA